MPEKKTPLTPATALEMNDGRRIPILGFGVFQIDDGRACETAVREALDAGYRHIDTANGYRNEASVGKAIAQSGVPRDRIFVTTKTPLTHVGADIRTGCEESLRKLGADYLDLYLIHWPLDDALLVGAWQTLEALRAEGKCRSIGVSNFSVRRFEEAFLGKVATVPAVNQIEVHVFGQQRELVTYCEGKGMLIEAYSPLARAQRMADPTLQRLAADHAKTPAQAMIRYLLQKGIVTIPKSVTPERIRENADVFDFELAADEMRLLDELNEDFFSLTWRPKNYY
jgi:diketogulonate reductase-like aldo/keto reductase